MRSLVSGGETDEALQVVEARNVIGESALEIIAVPTLDPGFHDVGGAFRAQRFGHVRERMRQIRPILLGRGRHLGEHLGLEEHGQEIA